MELAADRLQPLSELLDQLRQQVEVAQPPLLQGLALAVEVEAGHRLLAAGAETGHRHREGALQLGIRRGRRSRACGSGGGFLSSA